MSFDVNITGNLFQIGNKGEIETFNFENKVNSEDEIFNNSSQISCSKSNETNLEELNEFNALMEETSNVSIHNIFGGQSKEDIPYPLKMDKYFGDVWHTSPTTFEIVFGTGDGDKPYTNIFEFDSAPTCIEDKNGNYTYTGTIDGSKVELVSKNNKIVGITQYSDDGKVIGTIKYDSATGNRIINEYFDDGKTLKSTSTNELDGTYTKTEYYENGNTSHVFQINSDNSHYEASYFKDGQISSKRYINSEGKETLNFHCVSPGWLTSLALDGKNVNLDMQNYTKSSCSEGEKYTSPDGNTTVILNKDGGYTVTINGETKKYNEKGEPIQE